jgi:hypothetical protein
MLSEHRQKYRRKGSIALPQFGAENVYWRAAHVPGLNVTCVTGMDPTIFGGREGIENSYYLAEFKAIFESLKKATLNLTRKWRGCWWTSPDTQSAPLLGLCAYPDLSFSSAYNDSSTIRSSS